MDECDVHQQGAAGFLSYCPPPGVGIDNEPNIPTNIDEYREKVTHLNQQTETSKEIEK